jgi:hypothetical protein
MDWRTLLIITFLAQLLSFADAQVIPPYSGVVQLPRRAAVTRIPSPNRNWTLILECPNNCTERKLWVEDSTSRLRKLVGEYDRSLSIAWAPDSQLFLVNDGYASDGELSYVLDPPTLKRMDLSAIIAANDAEATQFLKAGHSYLRATRWLNSHELLVVLFGHFDEPPARGFTIQYRVDLNGSARKLSQHSVEEPQ